MKNTSLCKHFFLLQCLFLLSLSFFYKEQAEAASLNWYVKKYKHLSINKQQMRQVKKYQHLIDYFASFAYIQPKRKVNPDFVKALMLAESNGDTKALSSKGAKGLCQIMFPTGKQAAEELARKNINFKYVSRKRLQNLRPEDLHNPSINILITCYLIAKYNYNFKGKLDLVVSAWNAGENSIRNNRPPPYKETLDLIGKVNGYFIYLLKQ